MRTRLMRAGLARSGAESRKAWAVCKAKGCEANLVFHHCTKKGQVEMACPFYLRIICRPKQIKKLKSAICRRRIPQFYVLNFEFCTKKDWPLLPRRGLVRPWIPKGHKNYSNLNNLLRLWDVILNSSINNRLQKTRFYHCRPLHLKHCFFRYNCQFVLYCCRYFGRQHH